MAESIPMTDNKIIINFSGVMRKNIHQLPSLLKLLIDNNVKTWEVFFLIQTGRAIDSEDLTPVYINYRVLLHIPKFICKESTWLHIPVMPHENYSGDLYYELMDQTVDLLGLPDSRNPPQGTSSLYKEKYLPCFNIVVNQ